MTPENELVRYEFSKDLLEQKPENLVFVDESGIKTGAGVNWGWSYSGNRLVEVRPKNQSKNLSMVVAIAAAGVLAAGCKLGSINGETFEGWVQEVLAPVLKPGQIVIMDNASIHNRESVKDAIEKVGAKLWYQPAYSPELNAAEEWWAEVKGVAKRQVTDLGRKEIEELRRCVDYSMRWCSKANTEAYVRHVFEYARMTVVKYEARMMTNAA